MIRRTITALLLTAVACSAAVAAQFASPTYNEAADLAGGAKAPNAAYDGNTAKGAVQGEVNGALTAGELLVPKTVPNASSAHDVLRPASVPSPDGSAKEGFFSRRSLISAGAGAAAGAAGGWWLGGPIGALIGAVAGLAIGFLMSKLMR